MTNPGSGFLKKDAITADLGALAGEAALRFLLSLPSLLSPDPGWVEPWPPKELKVMDKNLQEILCDCIKL